MARWLIRFKIAIFQIASLLKWTPRDTQKDMVYLILSFLMNILTSPKKG